MRDQLLAGEHLALVAIVLALLQQLPTGFHAPRPTSGGSSLWAGVPTVGGEPDPDAAALRKALLSVLRCGLIAGLDACHPNVNPNVADTCCAMPSGLYSTYSSIMTVLTCKTRQTRWLTRAASRYASTPSMRQICRILFAASVMQGAVHWSGP